MTMLKTLADKQDLILLAEIGVLIHDLGKLSREFVAVKSRNRLKGPGWWKDDFHTNVVKLHRLCAVPSTMQVYISSSNQSVDMAALIQNAVRQTCHAIEQVFSSRLGAEVTNLLQDAVEQRLKAAKDVANLKNQLSMLFLYEEKQDTWGGYLKAAIEKRYGKGSSRSIQLITALAEGWARVETSTAALHSDMDALLAHENRLKQEAEVGDDFLPSALKTQLMTPMTLAGETTCVKDLIEMHHGDHWDIPYLIRLLKADPDPWKGVDGFDSWIDKGQVSDDAKQAVSHTFIATAFGHEPESQRIALDDLTDVRHRYANALTNALQHIKQAGGKLSEDGWLELLCDPKIGLRARTETAFRQALGETRRAANDVTLWDHCYSTASLYKAALAKVLLERALDAEYEFPPPSTIGWRFLRVEVDGLGFFGQAHHVTDLLGRQQVVKEALDQVREKLEVAYPLGNEVYRDENGSVFVMPGLADREAHEKLSREVKYLVLQTFHQAGPGDELVPHLAWNGNNDGPPVRRRSDDMPDIDMPDMMEAFGKLVSQAPGPATADPQAMDGWWKDAQSAGKEVCTVCGVRPVGYRPKGAQMPKWVTPDKAEKRHVCCVCLNRRGRRAETWLTKESDHTIWADEVVDVNGRFALIVGRFGLDQWLDGTLVRTMLVTPGKGKNPSPARIRRVWETTQHFWETVQTEAIPDVLRKQRPRLAITPRNKDQLADPNPKKGLGQYHTYELQIGGASIGVVWDPVGKELILTEYLRDLSRRLGLPEKDWKDETSAAGGLKSWLEDRAGGGSWPLFEPSGYLSPAAETGYTIEMECAHDDVSRYTPHIPLLTEPSLFMALVPADKAMDVVSAIKEKYDQEMARVRDRLPLHLGLVFAPRRTPLAAVLEAGRAMLKMPNDWEAWEIIGKEIIEKTLDDNRQVSEKAILGICPVRQERKPSAEQPQPDDSSSGGEPVCVTWHYPLLMGDGQTPDLWYPHFLLHEPDERLEEKKNQGLVPKGEEPKLKKQDGDFAFVSEATGTVFIRPSRFDFEFLDTTARRFEIAYQTSKVSGTSEVSRLSRRTRPFLLDDLERLETLWTELCYLEKSQRHQVISTIEATREAWFGADRKGQSLTDGVFRQFVRDTLAGAAWPERWRWKDICQAKTDKQLVTAGVAGELADLAELHMEILKE